MIQQQTLLKVSDNSGAKTAKCIKVLGGFNKKTAKIGQVIVVTIKELRNKSKYSSKVQKGDVYKALIIRTTKNYKTKDGSSIFFNNNSISLIDKQGKPLGSRIIGPLPKRFKKKKFSKFTNISFGTV